MSNFSAVLAQYFKSTGAALNQPEIRKLDLSENRRTGVNVLPLLNETPVPEPFNGCMEPLKTFVFLEQFLLNRYPNLESLSSYERYRALPKTCRLERIVAEIYRILRSYYKTMIHSSGSIACENTRISVHLVANPNVYSFRIFKSGMENITSAAVYYMLNGSSMYPDAYVEGILTAYYADIFDQIRDYHDECGELNVINTRQSINRHFRMAAGNPTYTFENNLVKFTVEQMYADQRLYPIDFYIEVDQKLHIIPVEALENGTLSVSDLPRWKARE